MKNILLKNFQPHNLYVKPNLISLAFFDDRISGKQKTNLISLAFFDDRINGKQKTLMVQNLQKPHIEIELTKDTNIQDLISEHFSSYLAR